MRLAIANIPRPFLLEPRVVAQNGAGTWHDLQDLLGETGLAHVQS